MRTLERARMRAGLILTYLALTGWSLVCLFPVYWLTVTSLKGEADILARPAYLPFWDFIPTLASWSFVLADPYDNLKLRYFNSAIVALGSTMLTLIFAGMAVYAVTRLRPEFSWNRVALVAGAALAASSILLVSRPLMGFALAFVAAAFMALAMAIKWRGPVLHGRDLMFGLLATRILPPIVLVVPIYLMTQRIGLLDTQLVLIAVYSATNLPVAIWLLTPVLGKAATDQEEAAQLDGASHLLIFFSITVPMAAGGIAASGLVIFVLCWNEYLFAAFLAADHAMTLPPWLAGQMSMKEAQAGGEAEELARLSAAAVLMVAPLLAVSLSIQRVLGRIMGQRL